MKRLLPVEFLAMVEELGVESTRESKSGTRERVSPVLLGSDNTMGCCQGDRS